MEYCEGDNVLVYLSTKTRENEELEYRFCKVVLVGEFDLICETSNTFKKLFKVSKQRCIPILNKNILHDQFHPIKPKKGDLVTSIRDSFSSGREMFTGIVEDIIYDPTSNQDEVFIIRTGAKTTRAYLENIIIIESTK